MAEEDLENIEENAANASESSESLFKSTSPITIMVGIFFVIAAAFILSYSYQTGKLREFELPLHLLTLDPTVTLVIFSLLGIASVSVLTAQMLSIKKGAEIGRNEKISDFFAATCTAVTAGYVCSGFISTVTTGSLPTEMIYIIIIYFLVVFFYMKKGNNKTICNAVSVAFFVILMVNCHFLGIISAKTGSKALTKVNGETFCLASVTQENFLLAGYNRNRKVFTGRILILDKKNTDNLVFTKY